MIDVREATLADVQEVVANAKEYYSTDKDLEQVLNHAITRAHVMKDELGRIGMMFGFYQVFDGVVEIWAVTTNHFDYRKIAYTRLIKGKINQTMALDGVHRMQLYTKSKYPGLRKFAEALGFTLEGRHPKMGSDQEEFLSFGRVK